MDLSELEGNHYLIVVDYFLNFIEVAPLQRDTRTSSILKHIKQNVARYGIMDTIISDNGPQYTSAECQDFTEKYGISHITIATAVLRERFEGRFGLEYRFTAHFSNNQSVAI